MNNNNKNKLFEKLRAKVRVDIIGLGCYLNKTSGACCIGIEKNIGRTDRVASGVLNN